MKRILFLLTIPLSSLGMEGLLTQDQSAKKSNDISDLHIKKCIEKYNKLPGEPLFEKNNAVTPEVVANHFVSKGLSYYSSRPGAFQLSDEVKNDFTQANSL